MKAIIEGLLFVSGEEGLTLKQLCDVLEKDENDVKKCIMELYKEYESNDRGIQIEFLGSHFKLTTKSEHKKFYKKLINNEINSNLSQSSLETLAIIAYNEPITRTDIDNIRGVNSAYVIRKLSIMGLVESVGKSDLPGRPILYGVTNKFLDYFGLGTIDELPKIEQTEEIDNSKNLFESKYIEEN